MRRAGPLSDRRRPCPSGTPASRVVRGRRRTPAGPLARLPIAPGDARLASFFGLFDQTSAATRSGPMVLDAWLAARAGRRRVRPRAAVQCGHPAGRRDARLHHPATGRDVWSYEKPAGTHLITTFLDSGTVDDSLYTHNTIDFTPPVTFTRLAKVILGVLAGLALLTVVSQVLVALRG